MKNVFKVIIIIFLLTGAAFIVTKVSTNLFFHQRHEMKDELYICPMHPTYTSNKPGDCPICGMRLVKKDEPAIGRTGEPAKRLNGEGAKIVERKMDHEGHKMEMPMSKKEEKLEELKLEIDPAKQQYIGIKTTKATTKDVKKEIKALGTVVANETRLSHIHTKFSGYIQKVFADYEGKLVQRGQPLFTVYSPELVSTQNEYLLALEAQDRLKGNKFSEIDKSQSTLLEAAQRRLELWDISGDQISKLKETRQVTKELTIHSPVSGFITKKDVFEGVQVSPQDTLYDIADLSGVWVIVEVYEVDLPYLMLSQPATVNFPYENIKPFTGKITYIYPTVEETTKTTKVRVEVNNPGFKLKPGMYVNAVVLSDMGKHTVVPTRAVIESGERKIVFVKSGQGQFTPKEVDLGPEVNDERVILSGVDEGDEVVTDGNFLLDSESNLETALQQMKMHRH